MLGLCYKVLGWGVEQQILGATCFFMAGSQAHWNSFTHLCFAVRSYGAGVFNKRVFYTFIPIPCAQKEPCARWKKKMGKKC